MAKINQKNFKEAIKNSRGIISIIARNLDVTRKAVYDYIGKNEKAKELLEDEKELPFDMAESVLFQKLNEKDLRAAETLLLRNKRGQNRGYGDKMSLEHSGEVKQNIDKIEVEVIRTTKNETETENNKSL